MTTIAYRDGIMAADTMMCRGDEKAFGAKKVFCTDLFMVGIAGDYCNVLPFVDFVRDLEHDLDCALQLYRHWNNAPDFGEGFCALLVDRNGCMWSCIDGPPVQVHGIFDSIGSGTKYAMGAMEAGATAAKAVEIAKQFDTRTGGYVETVTF